MLLGRIMYIVSRWKEGSFTTCQRWAPASREASPALEVQVGNAGSPQPAPDPTRRCSPEQHTGRHEIQAGSARPRGTGVGKPGRLLQLCTWPLPALPNPTLTSAPTREAPVGFWSSGCFHMYRGCFSLQGVIWPLSENEVS